MAHLHSIYDTDLHFIIDPVTRSITSESGKITMMQNDHLSERFTFEIPRYVEGHDMSLTDKIEIHYNNIDGSNKRTMSRGIYEVDDLHISPDSDDVVVCSWLISKNATVYAGSLTFVMRFVCYSETEIVYQWFTDAFIGIKILSGIYNTDYIADDYDVDVVEGWKREIVQTAKDSEERVAKLVESLAAKTGGRPRGNYKSSEVYDILDNVSHNNILWMCLQPNTAGVEPSDAHREQWIKLIELTPITNDEIDIMEPIEVTEPDSQTVLELIDIRKAADGTAYGSAGEAVRTQISYLKNLIDSMKLSISVLNDSGIEMNEQISGLYDSIEIMNAQISALENSSTEMGTQISDLQISNETLGNQMTNFKNDLTQNVQSIVSSSVDISLLDVVYGEVFVVTSNLVADRQLLYNWDFTSGMVDSISGVVGTLNNVAKLNDAGLFLPYGNATDGYMKSYAYFENVFARGRDVEIDIASATPSFDSANHGRLLMIDSGNSNFDEGFIYRNTGIWSFYMASGWDNGFEGIGKTDIGGKTLRIRALHDGTLKLYLNDILVGISNRVLPTTHVNVTIGSDARAYTGVTVSAMRIYELPET